MAMPITSHAGAAPIVSQAAAGCTGSLVFTARNKTIAVRIFVGTRSAKGDRERER